LPLPFETVDLDGCGYCYSCRFCFETVSLASSESSRLPRGRHCARTCWRDHHGGRLEPEEPADLCAGGSCPVRYQPRQPGRAFDRRRQQAWPQVARPKTAALARKLTWSVAALLWGNSSNARAKRTGPRL